MEVNFVQARSGRIYMSIDGNVIELLHCQVMTLLHIIKAQINFENKNEFDLDYYQSVYGADEATSLYLTLKEEGIDIDGTIPQQIRRSQQGITSSAPDIMDSPVDRTMLSTRAYNSLIYNLVNAGYKYKEAPTYKDVICHIPSLYAAKKCGVKTATEIINYFYEQGITVERWRNEFKECEYFKENFKYNNTEE